jgi:ArsR family transcriptional regulator
MQLERPFVKDMHSSRRNKIQEFGESMALIQDDSDIERASRSLKAMSHPLRLKILCTLGEDEVSVHDIVSKVGSSQSNISQHLAILREKGILDARKDANRVFYRVADSRTLQLIAMMRQVFCTHAH